MGVFHSRIKFEPAIPPFQKIQEQFLLQTGLKLELMAKLNLVHLSSNQKEIAALLYQDAVQAEAIWKKSVDYAVSNKRDEFYSELGKYNYLATADFYVAGHFVLPFDVEGTTIEFSYDGSYFFYIIVSLEKVFHDLGGHWVDDNNQLSGLDEKSWEVIHQKWRKLKKWKDYSWYNRPKR
jgi:hypothetical protein